MVTTPSSTGPALEPVPLGALPDRPLISILLANYNYENYISQSIESVLRQSYQNWEIVICDDGSTDNSVAVIESYVELDQRIRLVRKPNGGHTSTLNLAYSICSGDIICFLDSDDRFLPEKLAMVADACAGHPNAGLVLHRVIRVDSQLKKMGVWPLSDHTDGWLAPEMLQAGGVLFFPPPTSGISIRRDIAERLFPISMTPPLHMCPDQVIMRLAPLLTVVKRIPDALAEHRLHNNNTYSRRGLSADSVAKELDVSRALWTEQHRFLAAFNTQAARELTSLDDSSYTALLEYLKSKFQNQPETHEYHRKYLIACKGEHSSAISAFWRFSTYLPNFLFRPAVSTLLGQGAIKQFISRLKKLS